MDHECVTCRSMPKLLYPVLSRHIPLYAVAVAKHMTRGCQSAVQLCYQDNVGAVPELVTD